VLSGRVSLIDIILGRATSNAATKCTDSDGGINYDMSGNVTRCVKSGKCTNYADSCVGSSGRLSERYCRGLNLAASNFKCPNGCSNGACISQAVNQTNQTSNLTR